MSKVNIPYNKQCIDGDDIQSVLNSLSGEYLTTGPEADLFEQDIAKYTGAKYAVVCSNGTSALHMAMQVLDLEVCDTVLTSPITFIADANAARFVGSQVLFADICKETGNLDPISVRKILLERPDIKTIIPVHFAGCPIDVLEFYKISQEFGVNIVEDACHALGATYQNEDGVQIKVGSCMHSDMTIFSFHPIKSITTGEGGAITTNNKKIYERLIRLRSHGTVKDFDLIQNKDLGLSKVDGELIVNPWYYEMQELAHNYRISDFQCALGRSQLVKLNYFIKQRNFIANVYKKELEKRLPNKVVPLSNTPNSLSSYHLFVVRIPFNKIKGGRAALMIFLKKHGVQTQVHYMPIYMHPYYHNYLDCVPKLTEAEAYYDECLSLPIYACMQDSDPLNVIDVLVEAITLLWNEG
jgi:UDP-4-amino-4,6-dideoxy-N-acetyl-beta-L-altrosamine transaminase